jgi:dTDP-4-dehydrorhamnose reductase
MRILLLGANGQVGFELQRALVPLGQVTAATRSGVLPGGAACERIDLGDDDALQAALQRLRPDVIVNAAAYTAVDRAESEPDAAHQANAHAPGLLGRWCAAHDALLLHYSTDYVFDGGATRPWREQDPTAPLGAYGRTKREGEQAIAASGCRHLILRTAWVYAARGHNFLRTMLRLGAEREELRVVADQIGAPTPARWLGAASAALLARTGRRTAADALGVFHLAAGGETSWHGFAEAIFDDAVIAGLLPRAPNVVAIPTTEFPTPATRPAYSVLDGARLAEMHGLRLPDWRGGVRQVIAELAPG